MLRNGEKKKKLIWLPTVVQEFSDVRSGLIEISSCPVIFHLTSPTPCLSLFALANYSLVVLCLFSGCRADASEAAIVLLPSNITIFTLDFSGSGLSGGEYVTLGWNEVCALLIFS